MSYHITLSTHIFEVHLSEQNHPILNPPYNIHHIDIWDFLFPIKNPNDLFIIRFKNYIEKTTLSWKSIAMYIPKALVATGLFEPACFQVAAASTSPESLRQIAPNPLCGVGLEICIVSGLVFMSAHDIYS